MALPVVKVKAAGPMVLHEASDRQVKMALHEANVRRVKMARLGASVREKVRGVLLDVAKGQMVVQWGHQVQNDSSKTHCVSMLTAMESWTSQSS
jgi:hypothetical protein